MIDGEDESRMEAVVDESTLVPPCSQPGGASQDGGKAAKKSFIRKKYKWTEEIKYSVCGG